MGQKKPLRMGNADLFGALVTLHVLHAAGEEPLTTQVAGERLADRAFHMSESTVLKLLRKLERRGLLHSSKPDHLQFRVYALTTAGKRTIRDLKPRVQDLFRMMVEDGPPVQRARRVAGDLR